MQGGIPPSTCQEGVATRWALGRIYSQKEGLDIDNGLPMQVVESLFPEVFKEKLGVALSAMVLFGQS